MNEFDQRVIGVTGSALFGLSLDVIQVNVGLKCDLTCVHCHVSSSPRRKEMMDWPTMELILKITRQTQCREVDITGGAPEYNPHLRAFIAALREQGRSVKLRTNLTVWSEPGLETMPEFFRDHQVHLVASLPCYLESNVTAQRGEGVYARSIEAIRRLNTLGYGIEAELPLDLVYNPVGPFLPGEQSALEADYRRELQQRFGIRFTRLLTITNMPIGRYMVELRRAGQAQAYKQLLYDSFNAATLDGLMCRHQISIDWDGRLYDCDFNLALRLPVDHHAPSHVRDFDLQRLLARRIVTGAHCFGCTAGHGSSCGGALV